MQTQRFENLFNQYITGSISSADRVEFLSMINSNLYDQLLSDLVDAQFNRFTADTNKDAPINEEKVLKSIFLAVNSKVVKLPIAKPKYRWLKYTAAAIIFCILGAGMYFYKTKQNQYDNELAASKISPAGNSATLTLANGDVLLLDTLHDGSIQLTNGAQIIKNSDGEIIYKFAGQSNDTTQNVIETPKGGKFKLQLPDGTNVWLNAASKIKFSNNFQANTRTVSLDGEAYFEVAKIRGKAFVVKAGAQFVEVLGTHFNVNAYSDDDLITTTLLEGSVRTRNEYQAVMLVPGQKSEMKGRGAFEVLDADVESIMAWKNDEFIFKDKSLDQVMKDVSRWYNIEVQFTSDVNPTKIKLVGWVSRKKDLSAIVRNIESATGLSLKVEGRRILVDR